MRRLSYISKSELMSGGEADVYTGEVVAPQQPRTEAQGCRAWVVGPGELRGAVLTRQLMEKDAAPDNDD